MPINLLPHKEPSLTEKLFSWVLTFGRFIIIGTELVVLLAFASRFKLDRDLIDLHDKIRQEEAVVKSQAAVEKKSRNLQKRLVHISSLNESAKIYLSALAEISSLVPPTVFLDSLAIQEKTLKVEARALSGEGLSSFLKKLRTSSKILETSLDQITRDESLGGQIKFTLTAKLYANPNQ